MQPTNLIRIALLLPVLAIGARLEAARKETWVEVKSPHFLAYSDAGEREARKALKGFEAIRSVFGTIFPGIRVDAPKPLVVLVLEDEASMKRFLPKEFEGKDPKRSAGVFFPGRERNYAVLRLDVDHQMDQPYFVLFHEYTHSIVHQNFPALPTWLDEGLADFYGATEIHSERVYLGRVPVGRLGQMRTHVHLPLETLFRVTHDSPHYREGEKTGIFYAQSWALVHYLFMDAAAQKAGLFKAYLQALTPGREALDAARQGFGDLEKLQANLSLYSRKDAYGYWNLPLDVKLTDKDFRTRPMREAESLLVRAEFLQHSRQEKEAQPLLAQVLALEPQNPGVHVAIGLAQAGRGEIHPARQSFETAMHLGSDDFRAPYELAISLQGEMRGGADRVDSSRILELLESACRLCPDFPAVHMALCQQYATAPRDPQRALKEGRLAVELEPQDLSHRANLGIACMNLGLEAEAKVMGNQLNQLAANPMERNLAESYAGLLARFLEGRQALAQAASTPSPAEEPPLPRPAAAVRLPKFSLPSYLAGLGTEVVQLVGQDRIDEAIRKVEAAKAKARYAYDRKALQNLLDILRGAAGGR
ncbi:DUF1570 domain-containing protein [Geothrix oryzisoli]|uniref:DUF1570 domain-containing protein n=1 Tax=Geothrix oryzisoli TaxID=2922721 RepID=UPI0023DF2DCE|nr:DUF1570 domain-containing protein [Geothrix oryzisoli]